MMNMPSRRVGGGFSLIEILIVVAIIGIVAAMAAPSFVRQMPDYYLRGAQDRVYAVLMAARMEAISRSSRVDVSLADSRTIQVENTYTGGVRTVSLKSPDSISVSFSGNGGSFRANGSFVGNGEAGMVCTIQYSGGDSRLVRVWPAGRISSSN